ncbi:unnamed protein product [Enterobius vermicularis]|uniref:DNA polymerase alpha subunit B n=1 Tax=Enterobius vermicularis TaxID=51028 RepID=A0A0N4VAR0_ENTVE|nr:unnamed protein product [Enterobius vermicularis]
MSDIGDCIGEMNAEWISEQLVDFGYSFDETDEEFVSKMNLLSQTYILTADDLISDVIAFATNAKRSCLDLLFLELYEKSVLAKRTIRTENDPSHSVSQSTRTVLGEKKIVFERDDSPEMDASSYVRELEADTTLDEKYLKFTPDRTAVSSVAYQKRKNKGKVVLGHRGKHFLHDARQKNEVKKISVELCTPTSLSSSFSNYGSEKVMDRIEEICCSIELLSNEIAKNNEGLSFQPVDTVSSEPFTICGQIFDESGDRLTSSTCSIQTLDENVSSASVDLSKLSSYSLFPGKVVAMKGTNKLGCSFTPTEIFEPPLMSRATLNSQRGIDNLSLWCAAGPFTSADSLSYEQLYDLLELANKQSPDVLILMGPFIDRTSKAARSPTLTRTFTETFESLLANTCEVLEQSNTRLILLPSRKDAVSLPFYPVAPFEVGKECKKVLREDVVFPPDPAVLKIAGIEFAISTSEILQYLGREEIHFSENSENEDRIARLFSHLIRQRSLYPLYPPPHDVAQSTPKSIKASKLSNIPHIMILSSMLAPMIKVVDGCLCVNINSLARGAYMKLDIDLKTLEDEETGKSLDECCDLKVVRL